MKRWIILIEKCGRSDRNVFNTKSTVLKARKMENIKILGAFLDLVARSSPISLKRILIFFQLIIAKKRWDLSVRIFHAYFVY